MCDLSNGVVFFIFASFLVHGLVLLPLLLARVAAGAVRVTGVDDEVVSGLVEGTLDVLLDMVSLGLMPVQSSLGSLDSFLLYFSFLRVRL